MPSKKGFQGLMDMAINRACLNFGKDFNTSDDGNWYKITSPIIVICSYLEDRIIAREMAANIYTAAGEDLDNLITNDLFYRNKGNFAEGLCNITGENDTYIPVGSITILGKNNKYYKNVEPGIIKNKTLKIKFKALEMGTSYNLL
ncbi:Baseplate J-like protein [Cetobacterium ceti]|uniref:Baseplate J-like protein n=1 Tax=Cetobacterium ceti TaxID=180163 RepID=A0A1T4QVY4_9FUSO|nr:baseplate J/gp47 family protein [Cetobacterium ceti]SKA07893.1 Baseplate J-like protein [Cetobacterium ceti]